MQMKPLIINKRARHEYEILETVLAGVALEGGEVKMLRGKHGSLNGSYVTLHDSDALLLNAQIPPYPYARHEEYEPTRSRKLLLHKAEIDRLRSYQQMKGLTLIATAIGLQGRFIKVEVAVARGKSKKDRREEIKKRDIDRDTAKLLRHG
jgi:SsrA-binding protein